MIPDEAVAAARRVLEDVPSYDHAEPDVIRMILEAAVPHMLEHFANRIDWRCRECEDPIAPDEALKMLRDDTTP